VVAVKLMENHGQERSRGGGEKNFPTNRKSNKAKIPPTPEEEKYGAPTTPPTKPTKNQGSVL